MKAYFGTLLAVALSSQAAVIQFEISPSDTDTTIGISPLNEVPAAVNSSGSGNEISAGITFEPASGKFSFALGYGTAAGFADLTGPVVALHLHGPAPAGANAAPLVNLLPYLFPALDPAKGGVIAGEIDFPADQAGNLMAGLVYVNLHTAAYPDGEIRGQLIPFVATNSAPELVCPPSTNVECTAITRMTAVVSDPDGDALRVVWTLNGVTVQTNRLAARAPGAAVNVNFGSSLPLSTNEIGITVTDSAENSTSCSTTVIVADTKVPIIPAARAVPALLWPPNHKMVPVQVRAVVKDACGATEWKVLSVRSNEAIDGLGDGNTSPDWEITGDHTVNLRAERSGTGHGRVYTLTIQAYDESGNASATRSVHVIVPKSMGRPVPLPRY